jgi:Ran GTPase-activating protein (RanGAP) involved in mRNA processing and transport
VCLAFGQVLRHNSCVTWLDLSDNLLGEKGADVAQEITRALAYNVTLKHLDLAKNRMGPEFGR